MKFLIKSLMESNEIPDEISNEIPNEIVNNVSMQKSKNVKYPTKMKQFQQNIENSKWQKDH